MKGKPQTLGFLKENLVSNNHFLLRTPHNNCEVTKIQLCFMFAVRLFIKELANARQTGSQVYKGPYICLRTLKPYEFKTFLNCTE